MDKIDKFDQEYFEQRVEAAKEQNNIVSDIISIVAIIPVIVAIVVLAVYIIDKVKKAKSSKRPDISDEVEAHIIKKNSL
ncbi:MAG: hypothetical protein Q4C83_01540 [Candidatus Saccharibacteria bacterium]|nr:hypothetical protein [Candidatus Saccharibacteria bacterium]